MLQSTKNEIEMMIEQKTTKLWDRIFEILVSSGLIRCKHGCGLGDYEMVKILDYYNALLQYLGLQIICIKGPTMKVEKIKPPQKQKR